MAPTYTMIQNSPSRTPYGCLSPLINPKSHLGIADTRKARRVCSTTGLLLISSRYSTLASTVLMRVTFTVLSGVVLVVHLPPPSYDSASHVPNHHCHSRPEQSDS